METLEQIKQDIYDRTPPIRERESAYEEWMRLAGNSKSEFWVKHSVQGYINDELNPYLADFIDYVWQKDLFDWQDKADRVNHKAVFGNTEMLVMYGIGRIVVTLWSLDGQSQVTIVMDASDKRGWRSGFQSFKGSIFTLRDLMIDVIKGWDITKLDQVNTVGFG